MNKVGILIIGNEILDGVILDTNTQWIIQRLKPLNYTITETMTVRDDIYEIAQAINRMNQDGINLIITTGGLGPTHDDMTLLGVAKAFNIPMEQNRTAFEMVKRQYRHYYESGVVDNPEITESRRKMSVFPKGAIPLDNRAGGAPGVLLGYQGIRIVSLPGVPSELKWIFENQLIPILKERVQGYYYEKIIHLNLRDESTLSPIIDKAMKTDPLVYIKSLVKPYGEHGIRLWISAHGEDKHIIKKRVKKITELLIELTRDQVYTT
ncbi:competence/damage-inducible protein A [Thermoproteota archaeon]